jgi:hypothetical protein
MPPKARSKNREHASPTVSFRIPADLFDALHRRADSGGISAGEIGRMALEAFLLDKRSGPDDGYLYGKNRAVQVLHYLLENVRAQVPDSVEEFDAIASLSDDALTSRRKR